MANRRSTVNHGVMTNELRKITERARELLERPATTLSDAELVAAIEELDAEMRLLLAARAPSVADRSALGCRDNDDTARR